MTLYRLEIVLVNPDTGREVFRGHAGISAEEDADALASAQRCFDRGDPVLGAVLGDALSVEHMQRTQR